MPRRRNDIPSLHGDKDVFVRLAHRATPCEVAFFVGRWTCASTVDEAHHVVSQFFDPMNHASFNYVRTFRQRHCFTEDELAYLVSHRSHTRISRIEIGRAVPNLAVGLALQVLFRQAPKQMFPGLYESVEDEVMRRAKSFLDDLEGRNDRRSRAKRELLEGLARLEPGDDGV